MMVAAVYWEICSILIDTTVFVEKSCKLKVIEEVIVVLMTVVILAVVLMSRARAMMRQTL